MLANLTFLTPLSLPTFAALVAGLIAALFALRWWIGPPAAVSRRWPLRALRTAAVITLGLILLNPSNVSETPGPVDRPDMFYLLDASQSMAVGDSETRFEHAARLMREADAAADPEARAEVRLFRFGHRLAAIDDPAPLGLNATNRIAKASGGSAGILPTAHAAESISVTKARPVAPTDSDTQLLTALRQVSSRFGRRPPAGIVLFSDGRARDETGVEAVGAQFAKLGIPVHVAPVGDTARGGDVSIVACVAPARVRRYTEVEVQVFLRSYGYDGRRCEVTLSAPASGPDQPERLLAPSVPVTLHDGFQSVALSFRSEPKTRKLQVAVSELPDEVSTTNNRFQTEVAIDRTKIRVLYVEGSASPLQTVQRGDRVEVRGPYTDLQQALLEDEDIECVVLHAAYGRSRLVRIGDAGSVNSTRGFPDTIAELAAFDAIVLSDVSADSFTEQQLDWIDQWIGQRGGGLLMVGGPRSFSSGNWDDTPIAQLLPVELSDEADWLPGTQVSVQADPTAFGHPLWTLTSDSRLNREIVSQFPPFFGANRWLSAKPNFATVLANSNLAAADPPPIPTAASTTPGAPTGGSLFDSLRKNLLGQKASPTAPKTATPNPTAKAANPSLEANAANQPAIVIGRYGKGRTMAMAMPITAPWANDFLAKWGSGDSRHFSKFWRNAVYWLTESSSIGRRRLVVTADKKFYRPGETVTLSAAAFDEAANQTGGYRITAMVEPQGSLNDLESNYSPIRWPDGKARDSGEIGPFIAWGEEFELPRNDAAGGKPAFALELPIADALTVGSASQSLRVELTAMEEFTQVDSTSLDVQVMHDPFEQQNPFPNHELLASIARASGGKVIETGGQLAEVLRDVPMEVGAPVIRKTPLWSTWWLWTWLLGLLTAEWILRRVVGLA
jgi:uncharacterized membrane protein